MRYMLLSFALCVSFSASAMPAVNLRHLVQQECDPSQPGCPFPNTCHLACSVCRCTADITPKKEPAHAKPSR